MLEKTMEGPPAVFRSGGSFAASDLLDEFSGEHPIRLVTGQGASVSHTPPAAQPAPEPAKASPLEKREKKDNGERPPLSRGAAPRIIDEDTFRTAERSERSSLIPLLHAALALEQPLEIPGAEEHDASFPSEHERTAEPPGLAVGAAPAASSSKPTLFPTQPLEDPPLHAAPARAGKNRRRPVSSRPKAGADTTEAQAALSARKAALVDAWLAHPATVQPDQMSETERRRLFSGIAKLAHSSLTLEELPELLNAQARL